MRLRLLALFAVALAVVVATAAAPAATNAPKLAWYDGATSPPTKVTSWNFGSVVVGQSVKKTFTLKNDGSSATSSLKMALTKTGGANGAFTKTRDTCTVPIPTSLGPVKSCQVEITFTPQAAGESDTATLTASSKKPDATTTLALSGAGVAPAMADLSLSVIPFSEGSVSDLTVNNAGPASATGVTVDLYCNDEGYFVGVIEPLVGWSELSTSDPEHHRSFQLSAALASGQTSPTLQIACVDGHANPAFGHAEITASSVPDPDSTPNNGDRTEDDYVGIYGPVGGFDCGRYEGTTFVQGQGTVWTCSNVPVIDSQEYQDTFNIFDADCAFDTVGHLAGHEPTSYPGTASFDCILGP